MKSCFHSKLMGLGFDFFESKVCGCRNTYTKRFAKGTVHIAKGDLKDNQYCRKKTHGRCPTYWKVSRKGHQIGKKVESAKDMPSWESVVAWLQELEIIEK